MILDPKIKLLQLRKMKYNPGLIINVDGPLLSKRARRARCKTKSVTNQIEKATQLFNWVAPPRARVAVSLAFFSSKPNPPELYSLVKYYLDVLQGPVFKDDRQVHYLDASIWRSTPEGTHGPSSLYIRVRRLSEYLRMLELCEESDEFNCRDDNLSVCPHLHSVKKSVRDDAAKQFDFLSGSRIMVYDMPRLKNATLAAMAQDFNAMYPLVFDFGSLPKRGGSHYFQNVIASSLSKFVSTYRIFQKLSIPIEFDAQVTKEGFKLVKDLDNIMSTICSEVRKQVLSPAAYVNGYRVYVADKLASNIESGVQLKLLPPGEIESYNDRIRNALEALEEDLEEETS
jgi:hypothetical protein